MNYAYNDGTPHLKLVKLVRQFEFTALIEIKHKQILVLNKFLMRLPDGSSLSQKDLDKFIKDNTKADNRTIH